MPENFPAIGLDHGFNSSVLVPNSVGRGAAGNAHRHRDVAPVKSWFVNFTSQQKLIVLVG